MSRRRNPRRPMTACERGVWIDTEGTIRWRDINVYQAEREALEDYCAGARQDGVECEIRLLTKNKKTMWAVTMRGLENIAKEISLTRGCIRTKKKLVQIEAFKRYLEQPRATWIEAARRARKILGV